MNRPLYQLEAEFFRAGLPAVTRRILLGVLSGQAELLKGAAGPPGPHSG
ncbi:hypothetical protein [Lentzea indica]|nr:hypothetical protein [Lentzea indica]